MTAGQGGKASLPSAWLSLDENDSDLDRFIHYLIAALRTIFTDACENTLVLLQRSVQPPLAVIYATLSNELEQLPGRFILVLDDYHSVHSVEVHDLLNVRALH